ncbi:MAG: isoamylase early set domain-containing protein [Desulfobacterales bacterium]|nr:isoamylase early set domain-containing protein [Desulfobacterales bacterium]
MAADRTDRAGSRLRQGASVVLFQLHAPGAAAVFLAGDFNGWEPDAVRFRLRRYRGDIWKKKVALEPGRHQYRFVVDGCWWTDPANPQRIVNPYGTENSLITVL